MGRTVEASVRRFFPNVTTVKDATKAITIDVTKSDASSRAVKNHNACAMAVACKRALKLDGVIIARRIAYLIKGGTATRYVVPESVTREVVAFDRGGAFEPGEYRLLRPTSAPLGTPKGNTGTGKKSGLRGMPHHETTNIRAKIG